MQIKLVVLLKVNLLVTKIIARSSLKYSVVVRKILSQTRHLLYVLPHCDFKCRNLLLAFQIEAQKCLQVTPDSLVTVHVTNRPSNVYCHIIVTWHNTVKVLTNKTLLPHYCHSSYAYGRSWDRISAQWLRCWQWICNFWNLLRHAHTHMMYLLHHSSCRSLQ
jgi:hypothetical protein